MKRAACIALVGLCLASCARSCEIGRAPTEPVSGTCAPVWLRDREGGVLVLRGANVSSESKWAGNRLPPFGSDDFARMRDELGLDAVRLLVFWEAIEPYPGVYDDAYLDSVRQLVDAAAREGLVVVVDMHQDVFGRGFGHAGAPRWACDEEAYAAFRSPEPWFLGYFEPEVTHCFDRFWNDAQTRAAYVAAWARLATALRGIDAVRIYDVMNEPSGGSTGADELEQRLAPALYADVADAVRLADPDDPPLIAIAPAARSNLGMSTSLEPPARDGLVYAPHMYSRALELDHRYDGVVAGVRAQAQTICRDATRLGLPVVVGELGARRADEGASICLEDAYDALDEARASALYWDLGRGDGASYGLLDARGEPAMQARAVARPHPSRIAGVPGAWRWDAESGVFELGWTEDGSARGDSVVLLPGLAFPDGASVSLDGAPEVHVEPGRLRIPQVGGERSLRALRPATLAVR